MTRWIAALVALAWLGAASPARADDVADAKARFRRGVELFKEKRWRDAMAEFQAAYRLKPHGSIHFNVAQCRERLEEWPGALRSYHDYLREVPDATDRAAVRAALKRIEERLAKAGVQVLLVYTDPPGAKVSLEGLDRGTTPLHVVVSPGTYALSLALEGHDLVAEKVEVAAGASRLVDVVLRRVQRAAPAVPAAPVPDLTARPPAERPKLPGAPPRWPRPALPTWIAGGTAVVAVAAGAWFGASARADARAVSGLAAPDGAVASRRARDAESKARTANVLYAVAGGAAATGVTLYVLQARF